MERKYNSDSPIVEEVREARKDLWAEYDFDMDKVFQSMKTQEIELRKRGRKYADHLKPNLPSDFYERLEELKTERSQAHSAI